MSGGLLVANAVLLVAAALIRFPPRRGTGRGFRPQTRGAGRRLRPPRRGTGRRSRPPHRRAGRELRPTEVALLRSGPAAAVVTALVLLHARAAVDAAAPGTVHRTGPLPRGCDPLARLVYESLARPGNPRELAARAAVRGGLTDLAAGLARAGLVLRAWRRRALRLIAATAGLLTVTGLLAVTGLLDAPGLLDATGLLDAAKVPVVAGLPVVAGAPGAGPGATDLTAGDRTLTVVALAVLAAAIGALALLPGRTAAGRRLVRGLRRRHADLTPEHEPDAAEWSPQALGLAVALYGPAALQLTFPRFAAQGGLFGASRPGAGSRRGDRRPPGPRRTRSARPHATATR
ncbi:MAG TPA: TIGR04222 domain-containing membrane protein [Rugosimonospora sp.]|jgi:uncharacterized protein (TIGR04222 family)